MPTLMNYQKLEKESDSVLNFLKMNILKQKLVTSIRELDKLFSRAKKQESILKSPPGKCPPEKILDHFRKHFNSISFVDSVTPKELGGNLPEFVCELQNISNDLPINDEIATIDEIQEHLLMLHVIHRMVNNLWSNLDLSAVYGNSRLKTLWKGKGSTSDRSKY